MTLSGTGVRAAAPASPYAVRTRWVIGLTCVAAVLLVLVMRPLTGSVQSPIGLLLLTVIAGASNLPNRMLSPRVVQISMLGTIMLAAIPLGLAAGIPLLGLAHAVAQAGRQAPQRMLFNAAMSTVLGMAGVATYRLLDGPVYDGSHHDDAATVVHVGWALLAADLTQLVLNAVLMSVILWASRGVAMIDRFRTLITRGGPSYLATGTLAVLIYALWVSAEGGPFSIVFLVPCLIAARWALGHERAEDLTQVRVIDTLNAAMDARHPGSAQHAAAVAQLSQALAEEADLGPAKSIDLALAGALLRVDTLAVPGAGSPAPRPSRALTGVDFLHDIVPVLEHRLDDAAAVAAGRIVAVAEAYVEARTARPDADPGQVYDEIADRADLDVSALIALRRVLNRLDPMPTPAGRHRA